MFTTFIRSSNNEPVAVNAAAVHSAYLYRDAVVLRFSESESMAVAGDYQSVMDQLNAALG